MNSNKSKQISILIILAVCFLIEAPLRTVISTAFSFFQPLPYIMANVFYVALFSCFMVCLKPDITSKSVIKAICVILAFGIFEQIISVFLFNEIIALAYKIIRPLFVLIIIIFANRWILKSKIGFNKVLIVIIGALFIFSALFNVLEYVRVITVLQNMGNNLLSYLTLLTPSISIYAIMESLCNYILVFVLFRKKFC